MKIDGVVMYLSPKAQTNDCRRNQNLSSKHNLETNINAMLVRIADWEDAKSVAINHLRSIALYVDYLSQNTL